MQSTFLRLLALWLLASAAISVACTSPQAADQPDMDREALAMQRFVALLERQPKLGTALDRVYSYHLERGTLNEFLEPYRQKLTEAEEPSDGSAAMIIGLVELRRGRDDEAATALQLAERQRPDDPLASFYLGRALLLSGNPAGAVDALQRAIERKPARTDLFDLYQLLAQAYQRLNRAEDALRGWKQLGEHMPDDLRVQARVAQALAEEGDLSEAVQRFELLAQREPDPVQQTQHAIRAAELKLQNNQAQSALSDFESVLEKLKPDSWLYRDVLGRIESYFGQQQDDAGLQQYYGRWLERHPDDIESRVRLARALTLSNRPAEAEQHYQVALKAAPTHAGLKKSYLQFLVQQRRFAEAAKQYETLDRLEPNNWDILRAWGECVLRDSTRPESQRKIDAAEIWRRALAAKPNDPANIIIVTDMFRQAGQTEEAIRLYRRAVELAPDEPEYAEYLGEYLHELGRETEAVAAWKQMATGPQRTRATLVRLSELLANRGYRTDALAAIAAACQLDPSLSDLIRYAKLLRSDGKYEPALAQLRNAGSLAENEGDRQLLFTERLETLRVAGWLGVELNRMRAEIAGKSPTADELCQIAQLAESARRLDEAADAVSRALQIDDQYLSTWVIAARIFQAARRYDEAIKALKHLAENDRRSRPQHLQALIQLEQQRGRMDEAIRIAETLVQFAPGNAEPHRLLADLYFSVQRFEEGLRTLRHAAAQNPGNAAVWKILAARLARQRRVNEAFECYWQAFEKTSSSAERLQIVRDLAELTRKTPSFQRLIWTLERVTDDRVSQQDRDLCIATAYRAAGDQQQAAIVLEQALANHPQDIALLGFASEVAESSGRYSDAVTFQRRLIAQAPGGAAQQRLVRLLVLAGADREVELLTYDLSRNSVEAAKLWPIVDELAGQQKLSLAIQLVENRLASHPKDWEALYRAGVLRWLSGEPQAALPLFGQLRSLDVPRSELSSEQRTEKRQTPGSTDSSDAAITVVPEQLREAVAQMMKLQSLRGSTKSNTKSKRLWTPGRFGEASAAALYLQLELSVTWGQVDQQLARLLDAKGKPPDELWDWYAVLPYREGFQPSPEDKRRVYQVIRRLAAGHDLEAKAAYLRELRQDPLLSIRSKAIDPLMLLLDSTPVSRLSRSPAIRNAKGLDPKPLPDDELEELLSCYRTLQTARPHSLRLSPEISALLYELRLASRRDEILEIVLRERTSAVAPVDLAQLIEVAQDSAASELLLADWEQRLSESDVEKEDQSATSVQLIPIVATLARIGHSKQLHRIIELQLRRIARSLDADTRRASRDLEFVEPPENALHPFLPVAGAILDHQSLALLFAAASQAGQPENATELLDHLKSLTSERNSLKRVAVMARACLMWWDHQRTTAIQELTAALKDMPDDFDLRYQLAILHSDRGQHAAAMAVLDAFEPRDSQDVVRREFQILRLAIRLANTDRAMLAIHRLCETPLDVEQQLDLVRNMQQVGRVPETTALLEDVESKRPREPDAHLELVTGYFLANRSQDAWRILTSFAGRGDSIKPGAVVEWRSGAGGIKLGSWTPAPVGLRPSTRYPAAQRAAISKIAGSGQMNELVSTGAKLDTEARQKALQDFLIGFYRHAHDFEQAAIVIEHSSAEDSANPEHLVRQGIDFVQSDAAVARRLLTRAFRKTPELLDKEFEAVLHAFLSRSRTYDLLALLQELDLSRAPRARMRALQIAQESLSRSQTGNLAMSLLRAAAESLPLYQREALFAVTDEQALNDVYFFQIQSGQLVPDDSKQVDPWLGIPRQGGSLTSETAALQCPAGIAFRAFATPEIRSAARGPIADAAARFPNWLAGQILLAMIELHSSDLAAGEARLLELIAEHEIPTPVQQVIAQALVRIQNTERIGIRILEQLATRESTALRHLDEDVARPLAWLHSRVGQAEEVEHVLKRFVEAQDRLAQNEADESFDRLNRRFRIRGDVIAELKNLNCTAACLRQIRELYDFADTAPPNDRPRIWDLQQVEFRRTAEQCIAALEVGAAGAALAEFVRIPEPAAAHTAASVAFYTEIPIPGLAADPMISLFEACLNAAIARKDEQVLTPLRDRLGAATRNAELTVFVAHSLLSIATAEANDVAELAASLGALRDRAKLQPLPAAAKSVEDRQLTEQQILLWLAARRALKQSSVEVQALGRQLSELAIAAAKRHPREAWLESITNEQRRILEPKSPAENR